MKNCLFLGMIFFSAIHDSNVAQCLGILAPGYRMQYIVSRKSKVVLIRTGEGKEAVSR